MFAPRGGLHMSVERIKPRNVGSPMWQATSNEMKSEYINSNRYLQPLLNHNF